MHKDVGLRAGYLRTPSLLAQGAGGSIAFIPLLLYN
jgi:hypothetical protein